MNILDKRFKYTPAANTDIKATFRRIRREQEAKAAQDAANVAEANTKTIPLKARKA